MAKFKITLKKDTVLSSDSAGLNVVRVESDEKEVIVTCKWCTEAVVLATKTNIGFHPVAWECIEPDVKTPEELAEEAANKKILEEWQKKQVEMKASSEIVSSDKQD